MKRNMLTVIAIALAAINLILTGVLVFVIVPASSKTNQLVTKVAEIIDLELESPDDKPASSINVKDIDTYTIEGELQINLKKAPEDDKYHYLILTVTLSEDKTSPDYKIYKDLVKTQENSIKEIVTNTYSKYTLEEAQSNSAEIKAEILKQIQDLFQSNFIINVSFGNPKFQ